LETPDPKPDNKKASLPKGKKTKGRVLLLIIVEEDDSVGDVQVEKAWRPDVDNRAIEAVKKWKFSPATKDGKPVAVQINVDLNFTLY
jgi:periplasmic protein TonB